MLTVDREFAHSVETMLVRDFSHARQVEAGEYRRAGAINRIKMHVARLFAPIL